MASRLRYLAMALTLGLAGCGDGSDDPASATPTPTGRVIAEGEICYPGEPPLTPTYCVTPEPVPTRRRN